jgi:putative transposase
MKKEPMHDWQSLSDVRWECKYHVVIIPKYRRKVFYGRLRRRIGPILRELCRQQGIELMETHAMSDHVHLYLSIAPRYSVAHTIGFLKGKSAVRIHRELLHERRMTGRLFWSTGYCVNTVEIPRRVRSVSVSGDEQDSLPRSAVELTFDRINASRAARLG